MYLHDSHTRVDLIYSMLSKRTQAWIDIVCSLLFFFPLMTIMFKIATEWSIKAWKTDEVFTNSFWYPPAAPYRTVFAVGLLLLLLQGIAKFIRDTYFVVRGDSID